MTVGNSARYKVIPASSGGNEFADNVFRVQDNGDATKQFALEVSGVTTGTTRTATVPDRSFTLDNITAGTTTISNVGAEAGVIPRRGSGNVLDADSGLSYVSGLLHVGSASVPGWLRLYHTSTAAVVLKGPTSGASYGLTYPAGQGANLQALVNNGSGDFSWQTIVVSGGALGTPSSGDASNLTGNASGLTVGNATNATNATSATTAGSCTGNSATASVLQTTRTIGGSNFNGSANVTSFPSPGAIGGTTPAAGTFTTLETTSTINLGHASDTTIARAAAGAVNIEGQRIVTANNHCFATTATIATGSINLGDVSMYAEVAVELTGEGGVADSLDSVTGTFRAFQTLILYAASSSADITYVDATSGADTFSLQGGNFTPTNIQGWLILRRNTLNARWHETSKIDPTI